MKSGYKIIWTDHAIEELSVTIEYLETNWSRKEISNLANKIEKTLNLISSNPYLFPKSYDKNLHRVVILRYNTMYYRVIDDGTVEILSFFSNRQSPEHLKDL